MCQVMLRFVCKIDMFSRWYDCAEHHTGIRPRRATHRITAYPAPTEILTLYIIDLALTKDNLLLFTTPNKPP